MTNEPPLRSGPRRDRLTAVSAYVVLFLLGVAEALIGCFQYSRGPVPLAELLPAAFGGADLAARRAADETALS